MHCPYWLNSEDDTSIAELCRREGIAESLYYAWSEELMEAGKQRLASDTALAASSGEVKDLGVRRRSSRPSWRNRRYSLG